MNQRTKAENKAAALGKCKVGWSKNAWEDYLYWQQHYKRVFAEVNGLIEEISRDPFKGTGKPEPLVGDLTGFWSRRIQKPKKNRPKPGSMFPHPDLNRARSPAKGQAYAASSERRTNGRIPPCL
jgi:toxin YoeB